MASSGSGYDWSASTFSPDGRLFQVEYATKAVENAGTVMGMRCSDGAVLGVSKPILHKMVVSSTCSYKRIHSADTHVGVAATGFLPDARVLVARAMEEAADYRAQFDVPVPPHVLSDRLGAFMHYFTLHGALRPFGAAAAVIAYDEETKAPTLHLVEPNGTSFEYYGVAVGKGKQAAKTELEKLNLHKKPLTCAQAIRETCKILTMLHAEKDDAKPLELELSWICEASGWKHVGVPLDQVAAAKAWAQEQLDAEDEDDDVDEGMEEG